MKAQTWLAAPHHSPYKLVALGGFFGATIRGLLDIVAKQHPWLNGISGLLWSTWFVNIAGAFLLGLLSTIVARKVAQTSDDNTRRMWTQIKLLGGTGFMGAFTTYGTWAVGSMNQVGFELSIVLIDTVGMFVLGILAVGLGSWIGSKLGVEG